MERCENDLENKPLEDWKENGGFMSYEEWLRNCGYIKMEQWVPIRGFEGFYEVSNFGRVKNSITDTILKQCVDNKGYKTVTLYINGTKYLRKTHTLVAESFIGCDRSNRDINHKDGLKTNNRLDNLEFCTRKENVNHAIKHGLMKTNDFGKKRVKVRCLENGKTYGSINECSKALGVDTTTISHHVSGNVKNPRCKYHFEKA